MQAARRLYLYAMAGITLGVIALGLVMLVEVALQQTNLLPSPYEGSFDSRLAISQAIAMVAVALPVWAVHWWLIQRGLRDGRPDRDEERGSEVRAFYLTFVLIASLLLWVANAQGFVKWLALEIFAANASVNYLNPVSPVAWTTVAFAIWLYHGVVRRADLRAGPVTGAAAWVPRLYLYGVSLVALWAALSAISGMVSALLFPPAFDAQYALSVAVETGVSIIAGSLVWFGHWRYAARLVRADDWRGTEERVSRTRLGAFIVTIAAAAAFSMAGVAMTISAALGVILPAISSGTDEATYALVTGLAAVPWIAAWWAHTRGLRLEPAAADPSRGRHQVRLETHAVAAVALAIGATGLGWLLGLGLDLAMGGDRTLVANGGIPDGELAMWLPLAVVGLSVWAWAWSAVVRRRRLDPDEEANSTIRRAFLYLTLAVALFVGLANAAFVFYRLVGALVGATFSGDAASELSTPLGALLAAGIVLAYHGLLLRSDQALKPAAEMATDAASQGSPASSTTPPTPGTAMPASEPATLPLAAVRSNEDVTTTGERRVFELVGPSGADLEAALEAARAALPPGIEIVPRSA